MLNRIEFVDWKNQNDNVQLLNSSAGRYYDVKEK